jgi:D-alanyl-lipoteichoic acid acyltransferase DltB (MBOAT superfamily)
MSFYSLQFAFFFTAVVALYYLAPQRLRIPLLLTASALFYISFVPQYIFILLGLILVDYTAGLLIERSESLRTRKLWLSISLVMNLGFMASFKYSHDVFGRSLGVIPIGLSFHTFQAMAYTIEVYRGRQAAERSFTAYALYVMFFPQIAAGPIERPQNLLPQFRKPHPFDYANVVAGLQLMAWGIFQKYVVADHLAKVVVPVYDPRTNLSGPLTAFGLICFSFQIFCDFAGYSDIALGAAQVLGFRLTRNFNVPFHADSMAEWWKRWHISLSTWMRDYVFFPLCGHRPRMPRVCGSIMVVFLANAVWHGARWCYVVEGLMHGTYRVTELLAGRAMSRAGWSVSAFWAAPLRVARTFLVFSLMTIAFVFFRSETLSQAFHVISGLTPGWGLMFHPSALREAFALANLPPIAILEALTYILAVEAVQFLRAAGPLRPRIAALPAWYRWALYYAFTVAMLLLPRTDDGFIYFRF